MWPARCRRSASRWTCNSWNRAAYTEARKSGSYNLALQQGGKANNPCNQYKTFYITDTYGSGFGPQNPDFQQVVQDACVAVDPTAASALYNQIQKRIYDESVEIHAISPGEYLGRAQAHHWF